MAEGEVPAGSPASSESGATRPRSWAWFDEPPGWAFHAVLGVNLALLLWAASAPGWVSIPAFGGQLFLGVLGILWLGRLIAFVAAARDQRAVGDRRAFAIAPALVLLFVGVVAVDVPLKIRWSMSRESFERVVADGPGATDDDRWRVLEGPRSLGSYDVSSIDQFRDAVFFFESSGGFMDDTGFACLPSGPFPELENGNFENPQFDHLGGCWYTFTAGW